MSGQVGIDIGATAVRAVLVKGKDDKSSAIVSRIGIIPLREGSVSRGRIQKPVVVAQAVLAALKSIDARKYGFILGYSGSEMAVSRMPLRSEVKPNERLSAIRTLDQPISPTLRNDEAVIDTNFVRTDIAADGRSIDTLVVAAARREDIEALQKLMILARCQPRAIDLSAAALMRALVRVPENTTEVGTIIDIGATKTTVATRQGLHLRSVRVVPVGGANITQAIQAATGDTAEEAEARKRLMRLSSMQDMPVVLQTSYGASSAPTTGGMDKESKLDEAVNNVINDLIEQTAQLIENDASDFGNTLTQGAVLSGQSSQLPGLKDKFNQRLGVPVQLGRPWAHIEANKANAPFLTAGPDNPQVLLELSTAIGLALWERSK